MLHPGTKNVWPRRAWLGGAGLVGVSGLAAAAYRAAPGFWSQYTREFRRPIRPAPVLPEPHRWPDRGLYAAWLGHSTVLLKMDGYTILTDPVFSDRAGIHMGPVTLGIKRLIAPALTSRQLPRIDLILLSHAHMDHLDLPSLRTLENRLTSIVTASKTRDLLRPRFHHIHELGWNQTVRTGEASIRAIEVNHWGARMRTDVFRGYNGYVIESGRYRVLFAGDTALTSFRPLRSRRPIHLAIFPIGAYNPWVRFHCTPEQAWRMAGETGSEYFLPIHHQTFSLGREPVYEPIERLHDAAGASHERIALRRVGQEFRIT